MEEEGVVVVVRGNMGARMDERDATEVNMTAAGPVE